MVGALLVASPGGHLDELMILVKRLGVRSDDAVWVSAATSQTRSLLADERVIWLDRIGSGERRRAAQALLPALRLHARLQPSLVISTGALFAVPHLVAATARGTETWFVDSATRVDGPSQTGRLAQRLPRVRLLAQGDGWGDPRWESVPSVLDAFVSCPRTPPAEPASPTDAGTRVVLTLGTERWPFPRAVDGMLRAVPQASVTWQTGSTIASHHGRVLQQWLPADVLHQAFADADVVVTHAGVGSVLACLRNGRVPVVLPRRARHGEHIDDHQLEFARLLADRELAVCVDPEDLSAHHLLRAASLSVHQRPAKSADAAHDSDAPPHLLNGPDHPGR